MGNSDKMGYFFTYKKKLFKVFLIFHGVSFLYVLYFIAYN